MAFDNRSIRHGEKNCPNPDAEIERTSVSPVDKPYGLVETDTFFSYRGYSLHAYRLRITLFRLPGTHVWPRVWQVGAFASRVPSRQAVPASKPGPASKRGIVLNVPTSMADLEDLIAHDIPVITSQAFDRGQITGANYSTAGHLWAVVGFTKAGNVVVNDPANPSDRAVRHVFNRGQFENVWLRTYWKRKNGSIGYGTGGVAYIIWPHGMALPPNLDPRNPAW